MAVSDEDRRKMARLARTLREYETDEELSPEALSKLVEKVNRRRVAKGLPPLAEEADRPEEEFYRRARALGLRRSRG